MKAVSLAAVEKRLFVVMDNGSLYRYVISGGGWKWEPVELPQEEAKQAAPKKSIKKKGGDEE